MPESKECLIELVKWYRDEYHIGHNPEYYDDMIEKIENANEAELEVYWRITDSWIDY